MKMNWIDPEALSAATHMFDRPMTMDEALAADGEKLRQLTGEDNGPWPTPGGDGCYCTHHPDDPAHGSECYRAPIFIGIDYSADYLNEQALSRVAGLLNDDAVAATMVAATISTRQAAGESGPAFVKRIVRSWLEEMGR